MVDVKIMFQKKNGKQDEDLAAFYEQFHILVGI